MTTDEKINCDTHGMANSTFVCQHLIEGEKLGFNLGYDPDDPNDPYPDAWCDKCETVSDEEGGWNKKSQAFANIKILCSYCYENVRERNWIQDNQEWDKLVSSSCQWLHKRQEKILTKFKIGEHDRWDRDEETGILTFSHKGEPQVEAEFHFAGSFSKKSNTWMWAWANNSFAEKVKAASQKIKEL
ncbi:MAG TPA: hypothetical protein ENI91_02095, partial [Sphingomonadales bacterium]|nr:hypothetical protein [Sphingomonadales bacterium]